MRRFRPTSPGEARRSASERCEETGSGVACLGASDCLPGEACVDEVCVGDSSETDGEGGEDGGPIACLTTNGCPFEVL